MLEDLDPYTVFYPESDIEDFRLMTTGQYGGVGAVIRKIGDYVYVAEPYDGSPAAKAGIKAGDKILSINGISMFKKNTEDVSTNLKGPKGTAATVEVERTNGTKETIKVTRDEIKVPDIPYAGMLTDAIGYVKLSSFTNTASNEVRKHFLDLKQKGMKRLIFDLRGNGGGLLIESVNIVNLFVPKGQVIVQTKARMEEENRTYTTQNEPLDLNIPIVVLIDGASASASEIVAGSLQDLDRAVVVGNTSFGKGLVQRTFDLKYGTKMKLTIAKYYTPSGRCVQRLEYFDREDGQDVSSVPDSLLHTFKTKGGREVIDGRGIMPDLDIKQEDLSRLTATLVGNNIVFNYAVKYANENPTIADAKTFRLSEKEYQDFVAYVLAQDFTYSTASEELIKRAKETIEKEGLSDEAMAEYESLLKKVSPSKERDLQKFEDEIRMFLENEIVMHYYYQSGRILNAFNYDKATQKALELLDEKLTEYNSILKK
jgi:C-terminal peptidase (prc)